MASMVETRFDPFVAMAVAEPVVGRPARQCADCRFSEIYAEQPRAL
jgi:hypothetical protein